MRVAASLQWRNGDPDDTFRPLIRHPGLFHLSIIHLTKYFCSLLFQVII